ncbi:hypothetical protein TNCV_3182231 [Trichonephila clavipes]|uniref:Uncharacterized protein n=1 Tax=Trichonephila clavipes TaxID=2585209 RepID=A0A8X6SCF6_TRICX|nr:hypothetical protein TNCV_3182231 [Trichonephila clavipes]
MGNSSEGNGHHATFKRSVDYKAEGSVIPCYRHGEYYKLFEKKGQTQASIFKRSADYRWGGYGGGGAAASSEAAGGGGGGYGHPGWGYGHPGWGYGHHGWGHGPYWGSSGDMHGADVKHSETADYRWGGYGGGGGAAASSAAAGGGGGGYGHPGWGYGHPGWGYGPHWRSRGYGPHWRSRGNMQGPVVKRSADYRWGDLRERESTADEFDDMWKVVLTCRVLTLQHYLSHFANWTSAVSDSIQISIPFGRNA